MLTTLAVLIVLSALFIPAVAIKSAYDLKD